MELTGTLSTCHVIFSKQSGANMQQALWLGSLTLASALILSGCYDNLPAVAAQLEKEGKLPKLDRSESVAGPDTDGNGVRDDIDAYLLQRFPNMSQRAPAIQMAKAMQSAVLAGGSSAEASRAASKQMVDAVNCLYDRLYGVEGENSPGSIRLELEAATTNTKARLLAYLAYNKSRDGTVTLLPEGDTCE